MVRVFELDFKIIRICLCMVHSCRLGIFDSTIDSRELRRHGRQSTSSSSQSFRSRSSAQEIEIAVLHQQA
jgi:hypothetical protein